jgi:hypothetical protein
MQTIRRGVGVDFSAANASGIDSSVGKATQTPAAFRKERRPALIDDIAKPIAEMLK